MLRHNRSVYGHRPEGFSSLFTPSDSVDTASSERRISPKGNIGPIIKLRHVRVWLVQSISITRIVATLLFAGLAFKNISHVLLSLLFGTAVVTDLIDGYLARKLQVQTQLGQVIDLVADKSLTTVSLLYAAACGVDILPIAIIAMRDIIMIGMRLVIVQGTQLLPTNRLFGGAMALLLWANTLVLICAPIEGGFLQIASGVYWACAIIFAWNLLSRLYVSVPAIRTASNLNLLSEISAKRGRPKRFSTSELSISKFRRHLGQAGDTR